MSDSTVEIHFVNAALHGMRRRGRDVAAVLAQAGISPQWLGEPRARVSFEQFSRLVQAIWVHLDDELIGFGAAPIRFGKRFRERLLAGVADDDGDAGHAGSPG